jgi:quercetin dioxygenase-like cupin family protein
MQLFKRRFPIIMVLVASVVLLSSASARAQASAEKPFVNKAGSVKFATAPNTPACITMAAERGDPAAGPSVLIVRFAPGCSAPWHWHSPNEHLMALSGVFRVDTKDGAPAVMRSGDFAFMPSHHIHRAKCLGPARCVQYLYSDGPFDIHYVDPSGNEIQLDQALKSGRK